MRLNVKLPIAPIFALLLPWMLSACAALGGKPPVPASEPLPALVIPPLPVEDARVCHDPGVPDGASAFEVIAETRVALGDCRRRHTRVVAQYEAIEDILAHSKTKPTGRPHEPLETRHSTSTCP